MRLLVLLLAIWPLSAVAQECERGNLIRLGQPVVIEEANYGFRVNVSVENGFSFPLSGVMVSGWLWADGRPLPVSSVEIWETQISGGLLPGERMELLGFIYLDERSRRISGGVDTVRVELAVENAADVEYRPLLAARSVAAWSDQLSPLYCR